LFRPRNFRPRRSLGQTFLTDANIVRKIVAAAELDPTDAVLEIGPGEIGRASGRERVL
jgi:16S rRNA (adenine1518-N6/adenine1519-N6)-dimethyltransferase